MEAVVRRLPGRFSDIVAPSLLGFALINGFTFGVDLTALTALRSLLGPPVWLAVTLAYALAYSLSFMCPRMTSPPAWAGPPEKRRQVHVRSERCPLSLRAGPGAARPGASGLDH